MKICSGKKQRVLNLFNKSASYILLIRLVKDSFFIRSSVVLNEKEASQDVEQKNDHESRPIAAHDLLIGI